MVALEVRALARAAIEADHVGFRTRAARDAVGVGEDALYLVAVLEVEGQSPKLSACWLRYTLAVHGGISLWAVVRGVRSAAGPFLYVLTLSHLYRVVSIDIGVFPKYFCPTS